MSKPCKDITAHFLKSRVFDLILSGSASVLMNCSYSRQTCGTQSVFSEPAAHPVLSEDGLCLADVTSVLACYWHNTLIYVTECATVGLSPGGTYREREGEEDEWKVESQQKKQSVE